MRKLTAAILMLGLVFGTGCGSDDDDNGTNPPPPSVTRITAATGIVAPSLTSVTDTVWNRITPTTVAIASDRLGTSKQRPPTAMAVAPSVAVQTVVVDETLYMRFNWTDDSFDVWPNAWMVDSLIGTSAHFEQLVIESQDQCLVLFDALPNDGWDAWLWQAHSSTVVGAVGEPMTGFAQGRTLRNSAFAIDAGTLDIVRENDSLMSFGIPSYLHNDTNAFTGFILPEAEADSVVFVLPDPPSDDVVVLPITGWTEGYMVPGYLTDQTVAQASVEERGSRWDISAVADYSAATDEYTLVLSRALNTGYPDDANLTSLAPVEVRFGITNESDFDLSHGSTKQGFTATFELTLP